MIRSRAVFVSESLEVTLGERRYDDPVPGQVLVEIEWAGVCGSDLHVLRTGDWVRTWPATPGHEFVGVVRECPGGEFTIGTRVVADSRVPCGHCAGCTHGPNRCYELAWVGEAFPGGFQERAIVPVPLLQPCPDAIEPELAVLAEPVAVARHAVGKLRGRPEDVLILGYGPIGMLVHAELDPATRVSVVEPDPARRQLAEAFGARAMGSYAADGRPAAVIDAAGYPTSLHDAIEWVDTGGEIVIVALGHAAETLLPAEVAEKGLSIHGSNGFADELPEAVARLTADPERFRALITDAHPLADAPRVLGELLRRPAPGKVVFRP